MDYTTHIILFIFDIECSHFSFKNNLPPCNKIPSFILVPIPGGGWGEGGPASNYARMCLMDMGIFLASRE